MNNTNTIIQSPVGLQIKTNIADITTQGLNTAGSEINSFDYQETPGGYEASSPEFQIFQFEEQSTTTTGEGKKKRTGLPVKYVKEIKKMKVGKTHKECSICMGGFSQGEVIRVLPCGHIFHEACVKPWFYSKISCPNCRFDLLKHFSTRPVTIDDKNSNKDDTSDTEVKKHITNTNTAPGPSGVMA